LSTVDAEMLRSAQHDKLRSELRTESRDLRLSVLSFRFRITGSQFSVLGSGLAAEHAVRSHLFEQLLGLVAKREQALVDLFAALVQALAVDLRQPPANLVERFLDAPERLLGGLMRLVGDDLALVLERPD